LIANPAVILHPKDEQIYDRRHKPAQIRATTTTFGRKNQKDRHKTTEYQR